MGVNSGPNSVIEGLIFAIDAGNLSSYSGTGTSVVEISRISASTSLQSGVIYYNTSPKGYFQFDGINDNIPVTLTNVGTTTTIEIWMKMKAFVNGMPFGFNNYTIWTGGGGGGTLGFNTAGGDSHGLTSTQVTNLGLLNQWKHYIFEMRSDVSYTNNKIYIDAASQTLSQVGGTEQTGNRNFNNGVGRISCWVFDNNYHQTMDVALFRVYNRALSQTEINKNFNLFRKRFYPEENIVSNGLILNLDLGNYSSYRGTGTSITDLSGIGNTGTLTNGPIFSSANRGNLSFDGVDDYIDVPSITSITGDFTVGIWFYTTSAADGFYKRLVDLDYVTGFWLGRNANTNSWGGGILEANLPYGIYLPFANGQWHYLVSIRSGTTHILYGDGISSTTSNTVSSGNLSATRLFIAREPGASASFFNGNIAQVQIYNRALTATEVQQNYNALKQRFGLT
jgi:hypothetical protein